MDEILSADISCRHLREWAAAETRKRRFKILNPNLHRGERIRHSHPIRVVEMTAARYSRIEIQDLLEQTSHLIWLRVPRGIGEADVLQPASKYLPTSASTRSEGMSPSNPQPNAD